MRLGAQQVRKLHHLLMPADKNACSSGDGMWRRCMMKLLRKACKVAWAVMQNAKGCPRLLGTGVANAQSDVEGCNRFRETLQQCMMARLSAILMVANEIASHRWLAKLDLPCCTDSSPGEPIILECCHSASQQLSKQPDLYFHMQARAALGLADPR